jgi:hypothetical protein
MACIASMGRDGGGRRRDGGAMEDDGEDGGAMDVDVRSRERVATV